MSKTKKSLWQLAASLALMAPFMIWAGFALSVIWNWFVAPLGAPALGMGEAVGIALVFSYLKTSVSSTEPDATYFSRSIFTGIVQPAWVLLLGLVVHAAIS